MEQKLLIVEDDRLMAEAAADYFTGKGWEVKRAEDGIEALTFLERESFHLILLDVMMPGKDGFAVCREIRSHSDVPVIFITAKGNVKDKVKGLKLGADDYLVKPYAVEELLARIRALSRRPKDFSDHTCLSYLDIRFDPDTRIMACQDKEQLLSKRKALLMEFFMRNPDKTLTREQIYSRVWGPDGTVEDGNLDTYIYFLRKHLLTLKSRACIQTVHGMGYRLEGNHVS